MQCPKCGYEPTMTEMQSSPDQCPSCGVYYAKVSAAAEPAPKPRPVVLPPAEFATHVKQAMISNRGAQPVVVTDVDIGFASMVRIMVKMALAAIPAAIIVAIIVWGFLAIAGLLGRYV